MIVIEKLYNLKKNIVHFFKMYFTIEGAYTSLLPDRIYLKKIYKKRIGKELNLKSPKTFNEKINWLKLYDRRPEYTMMADKYKVRKYVEEKVGKEYLIPLIGCWNQVEEINFEALPQQFVLKCNHDNGVIICKNKESINIKQVKKELQFHLERDYYKKTREWAYKNIKRKIICEMFMEDKTNSSLVDYKFFCFDGEVKFMFIATGRDTDTRFDYYDRNFNHLPLVCGYPNSDVMIEKPHNFDEMIMIAEKLAEDIPHVRVDLYNIDEQIYFGEMTFYHDAGLMPFKPESWDKTFGEYICLPKKNRLLFKMKDI